LEKSNKEQKSFEQAFERLEEIVSLIEKTNNNLEDMVALVEEGMELSKYCEFKLKDVQDRINIINDKSNE
tara:strand:- start:2941 stop:3150 length:210 start_codon:yes stop_codon:yes gene_type:complete